MLQLLIFWPNCSFTKLYYAKISFHLVLPKIIVCTIRYAPKFQELHPSLILLKLLKLLVSAVFLGPLQHEISSTQLSIYLHTYVNTSSFFLLHLLVLIWQLLLQIHPNITTLCKVCIYTNFVNHTDIMLNAFATLWCPESLITTISCWRALWLSSTIIIMHNMTTIIITQFNITIPLYIANDCLYLMDNLLNMPTVMS